MAERGERLVARAWQLGQGEVLRTEAVLEEALAAVLETPGVWPRVVAHLGWTTVPTESPTVTTQDVVPDGRTDITLTWPGGRRLVLELKVGGPPESAQVQTYLDAGADVAAVAAWSGTEVVTVPAGRRYLGVVTWQRLRELTWNGAPLVLHQFHSLLDVLEVVMPKLSLTGLQGVASSWETFDVLEEWVQQATNTVQQVFTEAGLPCVRKDEPKHHVRVEHVRAYRRFVGWTWPPRWQESTRFGFLVGLRVGTAAVPTQVEGVPDLILGLHVDPNSPYGKVLHADGDLAEVAKTWTRRSTPPAVLRKWQTGEGVWTPLSARTTSIEVLYSENQGARMVEWMKERADEWVKDGVIARLAALDTQRAGSTVATAPDKTER